MSPSASRYRWSVHATASPHRLGMTLIEIMAVVVILGLLAVTLTMSFAGKMGKAKHEIARTQISQIVGQIQMYQLDQHALPDPSRGLTVLTTTPAAAYYLEPAKLVDPWGNSYHYIVPGPNDQPFEVISYGADNQPGGTGENADITSVDLAGSSTAPGAPAP